MMGKKTATKCSHEDSRLACIDCNSPLCGACLVQCPVGFRCQSCNGGSVKIKVPKAGPMLVTRTLALCGAIGFSAGWLMPFVQIPFLSCVICYFAGIFTGRWLNKVLDHKLGNTLGTIIVFGLLIGMSLSPCRFTFLGITELLTSMLTGQVTNIIESLTMIVGSLFCPVGFVVGILRPTVWGER